VFGAGPGTGNLGVNALCLSLLAGIARPLPGPAAAWVSGHVDDLRELDADDVVDRLWRSFSARRETRRHLDDELPRVLDRVESQMDEIVSRCAASQ